MKTIILSAGYGTRLLPLTEFIPKPLFPIIDKTLLSLIVTYLEDNDFHSFGINTHHLAGMIKNFVANHLKSNNIIINHEKMILNTGGGLAGFRDFANGDDFLVYNCDIITDLSLRSIVESHKKSSALASLVMVDYPSINTVSIDSNNNIIDIANILNSKSEAVKNLTFTGISILSPDIFEYLSPNKSFSIIDVYIKLIKEKQGSIKAIIPQSRFYWRDIGTIGSYIDLHNDILINNELSIFFDNIDKIYIGNNVQIDSSVTLEGFNSIGNNVAIKKNTYLKDCVVFEGTEIPSNLHFEKKIIYNKLIV